MKRNEIESDPDCDPEFAQALVAAVDKYEQSSTSKKRPALSPDVTDFFISTPKPKEKDERNYNREIQHLEGSITKLKNTITSAVRYSVIEARMAY